MTALHTPLDDEDAWRLARAQGRALAAVMNALCMIDRRLILPQHRDFVHFVCHKPVELLTVRQSEHVQRLAWIYRHNLPAHLAPKVNPDDPIVREQRMKERAAHV